MTDVRTAPAGSAHGEPEVIVAASPDAVSEIAAQRIVDVLGSAIAARGRADFATTGGSTPVGIYRILSERLRDAIDWSVVHFWWGDDRFVPRDHPLSNVLPADAILFASAQFAGQSGNLLLGTDVGRGEEAGLIVPVDNIHAFPCTQAIAESRGPDWAAAQYVGELERSGVPLKRGYPTFDLILMGLGPDGHVLSIFPGSDAFDRAGWALDIAAPTHIEPHVPRVTLHPAVLGVAGAALLVSYGQSKANVIGQIFTTPRDIRVLPAQMVRHDRATWVLDQAAAAELPEGLTQPG